jgi:hypothetical protein
MMPANRRWYHRWAVRRYFTVGTINTGIVEAEVYTITRSGAESVAHDANLRRRALYRVESLR